MSIISEGMRQRSLCCSFYFHWSYLSLSCRHWSTRNNGQFNSRSIYLHSHGHVVEQIKEKPFFKAPGKNILNLSIVSHGLHQHTPWCHWKNFEMQFFYCEPENFDFSLYPTADKDLVTWLKASTTTGGVDCILHSLVICHLKPFHACR